MATGDKVLLIIAAMVVCCFVLPFAPGAVRAWVLHGSGAWIVPLVLVGGMALTIWQRGR